MAEIQNKIEGGKSVQSKGQAQEEIEKLAYEIYIQRGCECGKDQEDWFKAEQILKTKNKAKQKI